MNLKPLQARLVNQLTVAPPAASNAHADLRCPAAIFRRLKTACHASGAPAAAGSLPAQEPMGPPGLRYFTRTPPRPLAQARPRRLPGPPPVRLDASRLARVLLDPSHLARLRASRRLNLRARTPARLRVLSVGARRARVTLGGGVA